MKKIFLLVACLMTFSAVSYASETEVNTQLIATANIPVAPQASINNIVVQPQQPMKVTLTQCYDTVAMNSEQLFYLTLAALNTMNYKIKEFQSKTGTVLFQANSREFLITIADKDANNTFIKILDKKKTST